MKREGEGDESDPLDLSTFEKKLNLLSIPLSLAPGATARLVYTLIPKVPLSGRLDPSTVTYSSVGAPKPVRSTTSTRAGIHALSPLQEALRKGMKVGSVLSLGILRTPEQYRTAGIVTGVGGVLAAVWGAWKGATGAAEARRRSRALKEVEKMR